jgi:hypothetical protein
MKGPVFADGETCGISANEIIQVRYLDKGQELAGPVLSLDQRLFALDSGRYDAFMHALDNPPAPGPKLRSLLRRVPAWQK